MMLKQQGNQRMNNNNNMNRNKFYQQQNDMHLMNQVFNFSIYNRSSIFYL